MYLEIIVNYLYNLTGFPNVIGCIDGSLIMIRKFKRNIKDYISRRQKPELNIMVLSTSLYFHKFKLKKLHL